MKLYIFYTVNTPADRDIAYLQHRLATAQITPELVDADSRTGAALAELYDVMQRPAVVVVGADGQLIQPRRSDALRCDPLMLQAISISFVNLFVFVFDIVLLARVVWSWFNPQLEGPIAGVLRDLTEPILAPIRRVLPRSQVLDFSPLVAFVLLQLLSMLASWLGGSS